MADIGIFWKLSVEKHCLATEEVTENVYRFLFDQ